MYIFVYTPLIIIEEAINIRMLGNIKGVKAMTWEVLEREKGKGEEVETNSSG